MASDDVHIIVELAGDPVDVTTYDRVVSQLRHVLRDVETQITHKPPQIRWRWDDDAVFQAAASPNGASRSQLQKIAQDVRTAFHQFATSKPARVVWPDSFGEAAKRALKEVVRRLEHLDYMKVTIDNAEPVVIDRAVITDEVSGRGTGYVEYGSIDGILDLVSVRRHPQFTINEHGTGRLVRCSFGDESLAMVKDCLGYRVVAEGMVRFRDDGSPVSVTDIRSLWKRPEESTPIEKLRGSLPDLTQGLSSEDFVQRRRGDEGDE